MGARRGSIGGGWRFFVEMDSYAIALPRLGHIDFTADLMRAGGSNSMGLILEARSPLFFIRICAWVSRHSSVNSPWKQVSRDCELLGQTGQVLAGMFR